MVLLGVEGELDARFDPFGDSANLDAIYVQALCQMILRLKKVLDATDGTPR